MKFMPDPVELRYLRKLLAQPHTFATSAEIARIRKAYADSFGARWKLGHCGSFSPETLAASRKATRTRSYDAAVWPENVADHARFYRDMTGRAALVAAQLYYLNRERVLSFAADHRLRVSVLPDWPDGWHYPGPGTTLILYTSADRAPFDGTAAL